VWGRACSFFIVFSPRKGQNFPALKGRDNPARRNAAGLGIPVNNALKGQYKIRKIVTHRVAAGWIMLPIAGRLSEYLKKIILKNKKN
jgi:hypothetical protein